MWLYYLLLLLSPFWAYPKMPSAGGFTAIKIVGAATVLVALGRAALARRPLLLLHWAEARLFLVLVSIAAASALTLSGQGQGLWTMQLYASAAVFLFAPAAFIDSDARLRRAIEVLLFSMVLASYSVFRGYFRYGVSRPGGIMNDPNYYAMVAVSVLPFALLLLPGASRWTKTFLAGAAILLVAGILLSQSRGGFVSLAVCAVYVLSKASNRARVLAYSLPVLALLLALLPHNPMARFVETDGSTRISTDTRMMLAKSAWRMIQARPLVGVGLGMMKPLSQEYNPDLPKGYTAHNTYLELAAELGLPACALFVSILLCAWSRARRLAVFFREIGHDANARIAGALEIAIASFGVGAAFLSAEYTKQLWILISFGLALSRLALEYEEEMDSPFPETADHDQRPLSVSVAP